MSLVFLTLGRRASVMTSSGSDGAQPPRFGGGLSLAVLHCWVVIGLLLFPKPSQAADAQPGTVFMVVGSDTAIWDGLDITRHHCYFLPDLYTVPSRNAYKVMDPAFRARFQDSFGNNLRMTWWMLVGSLHQDSENIDVPVPNLSPLHLMMKHQGASMRALGDEVSLHYHTFLWSDYNQDGLFYWNEALTFHECRYDFDTTVAQCLLEEDVFPVSFRSGWHYMDNEWQARLNQLLPFSMHNDSPNLGLDLKEPLENNLDWSKATTSFVPFHPSSANYQLPGDGPGWNVRSVKMPNLTQATMNKLFAAAAEGTNQVACFWAHLPEVPFLADIAKVDLLAHIAATNYPGVKFRYCTAIEAMQRWLEAGVREPPALTVEAQPQGDSISYVVQTDRPIFQPTPFVALKTIWEEYQIVNGTVTGSNEWTFVLPVPSNQVAKVSVAVTDNVGNLAKKHLVYLPEDRFLDDADTNALQTIGAWVATTNNLAWDTTQHEVILAAGEQASARWKISIEESREYFFWTQIPASTNAVAEVEYRLLVNGQILAVYAPSAPVASRTWLPLFNAVLNPSQEVEVECRFVAPATARAVGLLDVLRVTPLRSGEPLMGIPQVEVGSGSAVVTWATAVPATTEVEFGSDDHLDRSSRPNVPALHQHVVTLDGLIPGTPYFYKITSRAGERTASRWGTFATPMNLRPGLVLALTNSWLFTTNNLDGKKWTLPSYDDSGWSAGQGVFWADNRATANPSIPALGTRLPLDPSTGLPFVTCYFRTRFEVLQKLPGMSLAFSNYLDDGAVFYVNGVEVQRRHLPAAPTAILNQTKANGYDCTGDATCSSVFSLSPIDTANALVAGTNVLSVEVHNYSAKSPDLTFGSAVFLNTVEESGLVLRTLQSDGVLLLFWNGPPYLLEESDSIGDPASWKSSGLLSSSPTVVRPSATRFYRLRLE